MKKAILLLATVLAPVYFSSAQPPAVQQLENTQRRQDQQDLLRYKTDQTTPEIFPGENEDLGPQRILTLKVRHQYFEGTADSQFFYTSNARLAEQSEGTTMWVNTAEAAFTPPDFMLLNHPMSTRIGVRAQWYNYALGDANSPFRAFDFNAQTAYALESFSPWNQWQFTFGLEATRLVTQPDYDEFYKELAPTWSATRFFPVADDKLVIAGYKGYYRVADDQSTGPFFTPVGDRNDQILTLAYSQQFNSQFVVTPYYRFQYSGFTTGLTHNDYFNMVGVFFTYNINKYASVRTFFDYENKATDDDSVSSPYNKYDVGLGVTLDVRF